MTRHLLCLALTTALGCGACRAAAPQPASGAAAASPLAAAAPATSPPLTLDASKQAALVARASALRDLDFQGPSPTFEAVAASHLPTPAATWPEPVQREVALLGQLLWGQAWRWQGLGSPGEHLASYDPATHRLRYAASHPDEAAVSDAILAALARALVAPRVSPQGPCVSVDHCLARWVSEQAHAQLVRALHEASAAYPELDVDRLAQRPELVRALPRYGAALDALERAPGPQAHVEAMLMREGLGLATAMLRAQRYSGLDLLTTEALPSTILVAQPQRWMRGESAGRWLWPSASVAAMEGQGMVLEHQGRGGAALMTLWAGEGVARFDARHIWGALREDALQVWRRPGGGQALIWAAQWQSPAHAAMMAQVLRRAAQQHASPASDSPGEHELLHQGLYTALVVWRGQPRGPLDLSALLAGTRVTFEPREDALTLRYTPALLDRLVEAAQGASLSERDRWSAPGLGLTMELGALRSAGWDVQLNRQPGVAWYARSQGQLIQLHVEARELDSPGFESAAAQDRLRQQLTQSAAGLSVTALRPFKHALGPAYELDLEAGDRRWMMWHIAHGEVRLTLSVEAQAPQLLAASKLALELLPTLAAQADASPAEPARDDPEGVLRFQVEPAP